MTRRASIAIAQLQSVINFNMRGNNYVVETPTGVLYAFLVNTNSDLVMIKSTDRGLSWGDEILLKANTLTQFAIWYDKWSGLSGGLIHIAYTESVIDDVHYVTIDTESADAVSTETTVFAGVSATNSGGGTLSICRSRGGIVYCRVCIDAGAEGGFAHLVNANVPNGAWASRTIDEAVADNDDIVLMPGFAADADDMLAIFLDSSANTISRKIFDASANSWAESNIDTGFTEPLPETQSSNFAACPDLTNSQIIVVLWTQSDTASAALRCYTVTESAITAKTDVIASSTDDQGMTTISIDANGYWYCAYCGLTDGSETFHTAVGVYYRVSTDGGTIWGDEQTLDAPVEPIDAIWCRPIMYVDPFGVTFQRSPALAIPNMLYYTAAIVQPRVSGNIGI